MAVDIQGGDVVRPYAEGHTFKTWVDSSNTLGDLFQFDAIPNGVFVSSDGVIRMIKSNFSVQKDEHVQAVEKLISGEVEKVEFEEKSQQGDKPNLEKQLAHTKFKLGMEFMKQNKNEAALKELDEALLLDTNNFVIRKQRWYIRYPEKFNPEIDHEWQKKILQAEKEEEALNGGDCGPDGCKLPGR